MASSQDPFFIVKQEIQDSIDKLLSTFQRWERLSSNTGEQLNLTKELLANSESIEWKVDELDKAISVAARDPSLYGIDHGEVENRRRWTSSARTQVGNVKRSVVAGREGIGGVATSMNGMRRELMRLQDSQPTVGSNHYDDDDDFIQSESDRQLLLIRYIRLSILFIHFLKLITMSLILMILFENLKVMLGLLATIDPNEARTLH
ncbi:SYP61 [Linum perenne]